MILPIQKNKDNPILRQKAEQVKEINAEIKQLVFDMIETMKAKDGIGLAAPQIGKSLRIIVVKSEPGQDVLVLINPIITKKSFRKEWLEEGCLSLPDFFVQVKRPKKIIVQGQDINGKTVKIKVEELLARIIQHEIDHLNGTLIADKGR